MTFGYRIPGSETPDQRERRLAAQREMEAQRAKDRAELIEATTWEHFHLQARSVRVVTDELDGLTVTVPDRLQIVIVCRTSAEASESLRVARSQGFLVEIDHCFLRECCPEDGQTSGGVTCQE